MHSNWEKTQEYCGRKDMLEDAWLLELGWMTGEVIVTYIKCRWCGNKGIYSEDNKGQGVLKGRKLEEAEWYGCPKQRRKEENTKEKAQQNGAWTEAPKDAAEEGDKQRDVRRMFKILREV